MNNKITVNSEVLGRALFAAKLGLQYNENRDVYKEFGYKKILNYSDYAALYSRNDIASAVIDVFPEETWKTMPNIYENEESDITPFEKDINNLFKENKVLSYFERADKLAGIGDYAVLLMGFDDGKDLGEVAEKATKLLYLQPYSQDEVDVYKWDEDVNSPRYNLPLEYVIKPTKYEDNRKINKTLYVHYSRIIHVAENALSNDIYGTPRLKKVINRIWDLEKIVGGSAESYWRNIIKPLIFNADPEAEFDQSDTELNDEIEKFIHSLQRYTKLQGINVQELSNQIADPSSAFNTQIKCISAQTGIPQRILMGSEQAQLASSQDKANFLSRVQRRRNKFAVPTFLYPFINKMIDLGIVTAPKEEYTVEYSEETLLTQKEQAEIGEIRSKTIANYINAIGIEDKITFEDFLDKIVKQDPKEIQEIIKNQPQISIVEMEEEE